MYNPSAFPVFGRDFGELECLDHGMSLRDYFAGQAMVSVFNTLALGGLSMTPENTAKLCYERADAMLKVRGE